ARRLGYRVDLVVAERLRGDERAFERDRLPCTPAERETTLEIMAQVRRETLELVASCTEEELDSVDHNRALPAFASWRTLRQMAWHIAGTECRYYLPALGLASRPPEDDLTAELTASARHLRAHVEQVPPHVVVEQGGEAWTT